MSLSKMSTIVAITGLASVNAQCEKVSDKFADGAAFFEGLWGDAMVVETDVSVGYALWFEDASASPNDALTAQLVTDGVITVNDDTHFNADGFVDRCYINSNHKGEEEKLDNTAHPDTDPASFTLCYPWAERGCCTHDGLEDMVVFRALFADWYGFGGACGVLSPACENLFVQQECFYSCDPNAGLYRRFLQSADDSHGNAGVLHNASDPTHENHDWQLLGMPIQASFANAFYDACKDDIVGWGPEADAPTEADVGSASGAFPSALIAASLASMALLL